ncbi:MAG: polyprenyl synthetase family protein [Marinobacter sp.]|nr:polyprenyl synthetase family protein [Marinobacter sp.]
MHPAPVTSPDFIAHCRTLIDQTLSRRLATLHQPHTLSEAMRYSVLGGGKRVRPALCMAAAMALGERPEAALIPACAVELVHAYSLVHDDLPAMDDDDLRRGRPTTHIAFDEATAILAGDALQALAFQWLAEADGLTADVRLAMIRELASASGQAGMVGGQAIDLASVGKRIDLATLETMHRLKTGALIEASVRLGALTSARVSDAELGQLARYAQALGLAFQVQDDLLDIEGDTATLGKTQGADMARNKPTYPALMGLASARDYLQDLHQQALEALAGFGDQAAPLREMASFVVARQH